MRVLDNQLLLIIGGLENYFAKPVDKRTPLVEEIPSLEEDLKEISKPMDCIAAMGRNYRTAGASLFLRVINSGLVSKDSKIREILGDIEKFRQYMHETHLTNQR